MTNLDAQPPAEQQHSAEDRLEQAVRVAEQALIEFEIAVETFRVEVENFSRLHHQRLGPMYARLDELDRKSRAEIVADPANKLGEPSLLNYVLSSVNFSVGHTDRTIARLAQERVVVDKETVPVERVRVDKDTVTEEQQVSEEVRKEQIEADTDGTTGTTGGRGLGDGDRR